MAVSHHDQQSIALTYASTSLTAGGYHALDLIGSEILARSGRLVRLAGRRCSWSALPISMFGGSES